MRRAAFPDKQVFPPGMGSLLFGAVLLSAGCGRTSLRSPMVDGGNKGAETREAGKDPDREPNQPDAKSPALVSGTLSLLAGSPGGPGHVDGTGASARFRTPHGIALDGAGNLFVADTYNDTIRKVVIATSEVATLAGLPQVHGSSDGFGAEARFYYPAGIASDGAGHLFVADTDNNTIRKIDLASGEVTTLAGAAMQFGSTDGTGALARFYLPAGIASDGAGKLFVADTYNHTIRQVMVATGEVTTLAGVPGQNGNQDGIGATARFYYPTDVASDGAGHVFIADGHGQTIRKMAVATGEVTTLAGAPEQPGSVDGDRLAARFDGLHGMVSDGAGNLFIADSENRAIRRLDLSTGSVSLFAGTPGKAASSDGQGPAARFGYPYGLARDQAGNLFVTDAETVRKVVIATAGVTTLAGAAEHAGSEDGAGAAARFHAPMGMADTDNFTGNLLVADSANNCLRMVRVVTGQVMTFGGSPKQGGHQDGILPVARFLTPTGVANDGAGNLFIADSENRVIRKLVLAKGEVTTLAGSPGQEGHQDGDGATALFSHPQDVASDRAGHLFVADSDQHTIRQIVLATGEVTTLAGSPGEFGSVDGVGLAARFDLPRGMACDGAGNLYVADFGNYTIRKIVIATGQVTTFAGVPQQSGHADGPGSEALFALPTGLACDGANLFVADTGNHVVRKIVLGTRTVSTVVGSPERAGLRLGPLPAGLSNPSGLALGQTGELYVSLAKENAIVVARF